MKYQPLAPRSPRLHPRQSFATSVAALSLAMLAIGCSSSPPPPSPTTDAGPSVPEGHIAIGQLPDVDTSAVLSHTKVLSSDEFEGRLPGTLGEERTVTFLVNAFKKAGLKPGNTDGTYIQ